jgi:molybdopterin-guanine dinucleotide biosynthesis protein A
MSALSGVILSGGRSRRMGQDKAFLEVNGVRLIDRVAATLGEVCDELIVVANDSARYASSRWRVIPDAFPETGSLGGLYSGLVAARYAHVLAVACDMPFLNPDLLRYLARVVRGWDAAIPRSTRGDASRITHHASRAKDLDLQPLHAAYHRRVAAAIRDCIAANDLRMISFLPHIRVRYVEPSEISAFDPQSLSFFNANTPEEWQAALERLHA